MTSYKLGLQDLSIPQGMAFTRSRDFLVTQSVAEKLWRILEPILDVTARALLGESSSSSHLLSIILCMVNFSQTEEKVIKNLFSSKRVILGSALTTLPSKESKDCLLSLLASNRKGRSDAKQVHKSTARQESNAISRWKRTIARRNAILLRPGASISKPKKKIQRVSPAMVRKIPKFDLHFENLQEMSYGSFNYKMDNSTLQVPAWQRKERRTTLAQKFLKNLSDDVKKPSFRFVFEVLSKVCKKDMTSLAGLDAIAVTGKHNQKNTIKSDIKRIATESLPLCAADHRPSIDFICETSAVAKTTMKQHYCDSLQFDSKCPWHCVRFSLCGEEESFQSSCLGHSMPNANIAIELKKCWAQAPAC